MDDDRGLELNITGEAREDVLIQLLAVLLNRLGGEAYITLQEFEEAEGIPVLSTRLTSKILKLRLPEEYEFCEECGEMCGDE